MIAAGDIADARERCLALWESMMEIGHLYGAIQALRSFAALDDTIVVGFGEA